MISLAQPTLSAEMAAGLLQLTVYGQAGVQYVIQASPNLLSWTSISTNTAAADGTIHYTDPNTAAFGTRFYRASRVLP